MNARVGTSPTENDDTRPGFTHIHSGLIIFQIVILLMCVAYSIENDGTTPRQKRPVTRVCGLGFARRNISMEVLPCYT